jgi:hypothetical protein
VSARSLLLYLSFHGLLLRPNPFSSPMSSVHSAAVPTLGNTLGAVFIGLVISCMYVKPNPPRCLQLTCIPSLFGVSTLQVRLSRLYSALVFSSSCRFITTFIITPTTAFCTNALCVPVHPHSALTQCLTSGRNPLVRLRRQRAVSTLMLMPAAGHWTRRI